MKTAKEITLLVVDDDSDLREAMSFDFKRHGFKVLDAGSGKEALEVIKKQPVDVVLSDVRMPDGDGVDLLKWVKERDSAVPAVLFVTGFADIKLEEAYNLGAEMVFAKPFDRQSVREAVLRAAVPKEELWKVSPKIAQSDLKIELHFPELDLAVSSKALNIGRGGMFVALTDRFPTHGAKVFFKIAFDGPKSRVLEGDGFVRWVRSTPDSDRPAGCGVEFSFVSDPGQALIFDFIRQTNAKSYIPIA